MARTRTTRRRLNHKPANPKQLRPQPKSKSVPTYSKGKRLKRMRLSKRETAKWKIKRFTPPPRHINVKNKGNVVKKMIVRRSAIYPDAKGGTY